MTDTTAQSERRAFHFSEGGDNDNDGTTYIRVDSGAELSIQSSDVESDIVINAGGEMNCNIIKHRSGLVTNLGIINGNINGIDYGTYIDNNDYLITFASTSNIMAAFRSFGQFSVDTTTDTFDSITAYYTQTSASSRQVDFQIIDSNDSTIYFAGSNIDTVAELKSFSISLTPVNALPVSQVVNLVVQYKRTGASGVSSPSTNIYFTRTP